MLGAFPDAEREILPAKIRGLWGQNAREFDFVQKCACLSAEQISSLFTFRKFSLLQKELWDLVV